MYMYMYMYVVDGFRVCLAYSGCCGNWYGGMLCMWMEEGREREQVWCVCNVHWWMWLANVGFALLACFEFLTLLWKFIEGREREREREGE